MSNIDPSGLAFCAYDDGAEPGFSEDGATASACYGEGGTWVGYDRLAPWLARKHQRRLARDIRKALPFLFERYTNMTGSAE